MDYATQKLTDTPFWKRTSYRSGGALARRFYETDCSGAYAQNDGLLQVVSKLLDDKPIDGVIYHVLKGQIEYDFELERFEALFAQRGKPRLAVGRAFGRSVQKDGAGDTPKSEMVSAGVLSSADGDALCNSNQMMAHI